MIRGVVNVISLQGGLVRRLSRRLSGMEDAEERILVIREAMRRSSFLKPLLLTLLGGGACLGVMVSLLDSVLPAWCRAAVFAGGVGGLVALLRAWEKRRAERALAVVLRSRGRCAVCGRDLRGMAGPSCPGCGIPLG